MDRKAFKLRMQALKSYRDNNPGKGYWDWKVEAFEDGGEVNEETTSKVVIGPITEEEMLNRNREAFKEMMRNLFLQNEGKKAKVNPDFANYMYDFDFDLLNHEDPNERNYTLLNYWKRAREVRNAEMSKHTTPYIPEKEVMLTTGRFNTGRISTNVLDSLLASSKRTGYPFEDALGLAGRESGLGYARFHKAKGKLSNSALLSNWNLVLTVYNTNNMVDKFNTIINKYRNEESITNDELDFIKLFIDNENKQYDSTKPITENVWDNALKQFESGNYNPKDPTYINKVRMEGRMLMQDPAIKKWAKTAKFAEGGEIPPTEEEPIQERMPYQGKLYKDAIGRQYTEDQYYNYFRNSTDEIDKFTGMPRVIGLKPIIDLEDAANFTPIGDAIAVKDTYDAIKNRDWFGAGAAALSILPFIPNAKKLGKIIPTPTVNRTFAKLLDERQAAYNRVKGEYNDLLDSALESLIENEDAFRRAANADKAAGTSYVDVYTKSLQNKANNPSELPKPYILETKPNLKAYVSAHDPETINISRSYVDNGLSLESGLITHELGHSTDIKAGFDYVDKLGDPSKFVDDETLRKMYPTKADKIKSYLLKGTEIKSHMNEFRQYLFDNHDLLERETVNSLKRKLFNSPYDNLKKIFNSYKSKRQFLKDFNTVPMVSNNNPNNLA